MKIPKIEIGFMRHNNIEESQKIVDFAMSTGNPYFETCYFYQDFKCEEYVYSLLEKYNRKDYEICGKLPVQNICEHKDFKEVYYEQLNRVPGNYFDIYLLQCLNQSTPHIIYDNKMLPFFLEEKKKGNIKKFGLSIQCSPEQFEKYLSLNCWDIVQMPINYYDWYLCEYDKCYQLAKEHNLPIIAQAPMKGGLLSKEIRGCNNEKLAFDFVCNLDVEYILTGCSKLETYINTYNNIIKFEKIKDYNIYINRLNDYINDNIIHYCDNCNACTNVCKERIPISTYIKLYNEGLKDKKAFHYLTELKHDLNEPSNVCTYCNNCIDVCPYKINIPKLWRRIFELRV